MFGLFGGKTFKPDQDISDLSGKVIIVTGGELRDLNLHVITFVSVSNHCLCAGNTGLGKETVLKLASHNPKEIFLAARTPSKAEDAIASIKSSLPSDCKTPITYLPLDLTDFASIESAAKTFNSKSDRLDILMNNAGVMALPYSKTKQDYEIQFGTNHMGHALLTKLLLPTMLKTAEQPGSDVRIVNLSSMGHQMAPSGGIVFDQKALEAKSTWSRYGNSKLANILHAQSLSQKYPQITSTAVHPGVILTDLYASQKQSNVFMRTGLWALGGFVMSDVSAGALNQLWVATANKKEVEKSVYWVPVAKASAGSSYASDKALAEKLWTYTEDELKKHGY